MVKSEGVKERESTSLSMFVWDLLKAMRVMLTAEKLIRLR